MKKRGQLTAFVLMAFVVVILVVVLTVMYVSIAKVSFTDKQFANKKMNEVKAYVDDCIKNKLIEGLKAVGIEGLADYMKEVNCGGLGSISGIKVNAEVPGVETSIDDEKIDVDIDYDIVVEKGDVSERLQRLSYSYLLYNKVNIDEDDDKRADGDVKIESIGKTGILVIPAGTKISNGGVIFGIKKKSKMEQLTDSIVVMGVGEIEPYGALSLLYGNCVNGKNGIVDRMRGIAIETSCVQLENDVYAVGKIAGGGEYFVGSCEKFICCWNGRCEKNTGESCFSCEKDCGKCQTAVSGRSGIDGAVDSSGSGSGLDSGTNSEVENPGTDGECSPFDPTC